MLFLPGSVMLDKEVTAPNEESTCFCRSLHDKAMRPEHGTLPGSINAAGAITGNYVDENFLQHGFVRSR